MADNDVNLAALWVPVMAETSKLKAQLVKGGTEGAAASAAAIKATFAEAEVFKGLGMQLSRELAAGVPEAQRSLGVLSGTLGKISTGATLGLAGIAGFGAAVIESTKSAADFETSLTKLSTAAGETQDGLKVVHDGLLQMAGATGYSAQEMSDAMFLVEKAGYRAADGLTVMKSAAQGAFAEKADLKDTLNGLTNSMHDFGFSADQSADVMSKMITGAGMAKSNLQDFSGALHSAEPILSNIGKSQGLTSEQLQHLMSDLYAVGGAMTQTGMTSANAFQDIGHATQKLMGPTSQMRDMWGALGIDAQDIQDHLGERGVAGTMQVLAGALQQHTKDGKVNLNVHYQSAQAARAEAEAYNALSPAAKGVAEQIKNHTLSYKEFRKSRGGLDVETANQLGQWNALNSKLTGFSSAIKSGIGDQMSYDQALKLLSGDQETLQVALATTGDNADAVNKATQTVDQTTRDHDGNVKGFSESQKTYNAQMKDFKDALGAARIELGEAFLPTMTKIAGAFKDAGSYLKDHKTLLEGLVIGVGALSAAWVGTKMFSAAVAGFDAIVGAANSAFGGISAKVVSAEAEFGTLNKTIAAGGTAATKTATEVEAAAAAEVTAEEKVTVAATEADAAMHAGGAGVPIPGVPTPGPAPTSPGWMKGFAAAVPPALLGMQLGDDMRKHLTEDTPPDQRAAVDAWLKGGPPPNFSHANGGIQKFGKGGFLPDGATIAKPHGAAGLVQWAEPSTQGEAFIPLAPGKRRRSLEIWKHTGRLLGAFAGGGFEYPMDPGEVPIGEWAPAGTTEDGGSNGATTRLPNQWLGNWAYDHWGKSAKPYDGGPDWQSMFRDGNKDGRRWNTNIYQNDPGINQWKEPGGSTYNIPGGGMGIHKPGWSMAAADGGITSFDDGSDYGASAGHPTVGPPDENALRAWVQQNFGIPNTFGTGSWENAAHNYDGGWHHPGGAKQGYGFDFHGTTQQMDALANWVAQNYAGKTLELIHQGPGFSNSNEIKNGRFGDVYGAGTNAQHADHVHWAMTEAPTGSAGNPIYTTHSKETADRADARVKDIQEHIAELKPDAKQSTKDRLNDELRFAKEDQARAHDKLAASESTSAAGESGGGGTNKTQSQAQQFGSGLLSGLMSDMGFGNVLGGKSPLEWPLVKMFTGLLGVGIDAGNLWAANRMGGGNGRSGETAGGIPGLNQGGGSGETPSGLGGISSGTGGGQSSADAALASLGGDGGNKQLSDLAKDIPYLGNSKGWFGDAGGYKAAAPGAGMKAVPGGVPFQLVPSNVGSVPQAAQGGTSYSGGNTVHNDNRIVVQGNTMTKPDELVGPMQQQMNSNTYSRSAFGGLPAAVGPGGG